ncbi:MAG TPA: ERF family protein [Nocardioides sp.]
MTVTETQPAETGDNPPSSTYEVGKLAAALAAVQAELPRIHKGQTAKVPLKNGGEYSYTYADLADVSAAVLPLLGKHGLAFTAWPTLTGNRFVLRYELLHSSGESKGGEYPLPMDAGAQALGSAITYARRYCLCAVSGVAPDDDDDAAAAEAGRAAERDAAREQRAEQAAAEQAQAASELKHAADAVRGAWALQYGEFNQDQAAELYRTWSKGGQLTTATAGQLRSFAAMLANLPTADAGSDPTTPPPSSDPEARTEKLGKRDNAHMFVLFEKLGYKEDRAGQLEYLSRTLGRKITSRSEVMQADAPTVLKALKADVDLAERTGEKPQSVSEPATGAQSASGATRVPAGSEPTASGGA